ncbi:DUF6894 family protein [Sphingomonas sp. BAUL-RG-20F-R05-02]|uniref:DUF6894 family protein n=1 Tax=Sphingomonas sp. BAUL-RG-20F-R05-02 TaxID=2914830 RepID=UPI00391F588D
MPRYHLHIYNYTGETLDQEGSEYSDIGIARAKAIAGIRSFLSAEVLEGKVDLRGYLDIADDDGTVLERIDFHDAVKIHDV